MRIYPRNGLVLERVLRERKQGSGVDGLETTKPTPYNPIRRVMATDKEPLSSRGLARGSKPVILKE